VKREAQDERWMREAVRLARLGAGLTRPNPPVGAVVVRGGRVVGRGYHRKAGGAHAEVYALRQAGGRAKGATLYVTLEPCSTWGRTPPCTDAVVAAGIRRVVVGARDPNPRHAGRGLRLLKRAGIQVDEQRGADEAGELIRPFASLMQRKRPWVILKLAASLDGRIADATGQSKWISGSASREVVQSMRRQGDAIMVGAGTVVADDPSLLPRPAGGRRPYRVIVDSRGRVPPTAKVFQGDSESVTVVATTRQCGNARRRAYAGAGGAVWILPATRQGVSLSALMRRLAGLGVMSVLVEGGGALAESLLKACLVDEVVMFIAPLVIGGGGVDAVGGQGWALNRAPRLHVQEVRRSGEDVMIRAIVTE
jgi:diaminohydroxyphosphoribosylaminopyrimidine deaminase/5-amino-6-(5-phosphoribosylamino)uracil reductase